MSAKTDIQNGLDAGVLPRILEESYGPGAWHGADLKAALADVGLELAFWQPAPGRHNIAEIAIHHAFYVHSVRERLLGTAAEPFLLEGEDWFGLDGQTGLGWPEVQAAVETQQLRLVEVLAEIASGRVQSPLSGSERFDLVLGIACHGVYHAGQVQLIKRLYSE